MLSKEKFIAGMTLLKKSYLDWSFDLNDDVQITIWYSAFKNLTDEQFSSVIKEYYAHNRKPPTSIRDLTEILVNKFYSTAKIPPEKALDVVREIVRIAHRHDQNYWPTPGVDLYAKPFATQ